MGMRGGGGLGGGGGSRLGLPSASYTRRASTCSGSMFGPPGGPTPHKKRSIPNMDKRGSTVSASGGSALYGLVIPPKLGKDGEKLSNKVSGERRSSAIANKGLKIGNSHTSVIESTTSLYSNDDRRSSGAYSTRLGGVLPTLIDEQQLIESENEDWVSKSSTVVRIAQMPSLPTSH